MRLSVGIDIAKEVHWVTAIGADGGVRIDRRLDNTPAAIAALIAELHGLGGTVRVGLDVVGGIAGLAEAMLAEAGFALVHVPGLAVNRARQGTVGGEHKSDPRDARVIADQVRSRQDLRPIRPDEETTVAIRLLVARRRDLTQDQTRRISRLRQLLASIHPGLERALDPTAKAPLVLLTRFVSAGEIKAAGRARIAKHLKRTPGLRVRPSAWPKRRWRLRRPRPSVCRARPPWPRSCASSPTKPWPSAGASAPSTRSWRRWSPATLTGPSSAACPAWGVVMTAEFIAAAGDISPASAPPDALAAAAGLAPILRQSGKAGALRRAYGGDKALKRVFFQSAFCAVSTKDPLSKAFYDRKRREGHRHVQALVALARRAASP